MSDPLDCSSPRQNPGFLLAHTRLGLSKGLLRVFQNAGHELTGEHWGLLNLIATSPGARQTDLAARMGKDKPSVSRLLDTLENRGYLLRQTDPEDRRSHCVHLTDAGRILLTELKPLVTAYLDRILSPLDHGDYEVFMRVLQQVSNRLDDFLNETPPTPGGEQD